jgi:antitoxin ParD1/3/4/toxin ParE1/3/4
MADRYVVGKEARRDLDAILVYTAEVSGSVDQAFAVDAKLHEAFALVARNPLAGHTRGDLGIPEPFRVWSVYSYLVIYNPDTRPVRILRVWHGAQEKPEIPEA